MGSGSVPRPRLGGTPCLLCSAARGPRWYTWGREWSSVRLTEPAGQPAVPPLEAPFHFNCLTSGTEEAKTNSARVSDADSAGLWRDSAEPEPAVKQKGKKEALPAWATRWLCGRLSSQRPRPQPPGPPTHTGPHPRSRRRRDRRCPST